MTGAAVLLLTACSKAPEQGKYIPKSAALVLSVNSKQVQQKLVTEGISVDKLFEAVQKKDTASGFAKAMKDMENSGVDLQGDVSIALVPGDGGIKSYISGVAKLKDAAKFEAFLKEKTQKEIKSGSDFKYVVDGESLIGFDKGTIISLFAFNPNKFEGNGFTMDTTAAPAAPQGIAGDEKGWVETLNGLFHLKADESVGTIESFKNVQKEKGDVTFWMSSEQIYAFNPSSAAGMAAMFTTNIKKITAGSYQTVAVFFENGKIKANSTGYSGKELQEIMNKYPSQKVNLSMLETYPSENILGYALMNFDLRMVGDIIKLIGMDGLANMSLAQAGITLDDILKAFSGEIVLVSSDFSVVKKASPFDSSFKVTQPQLKYIFNMKVGDKAAFEKVMNSPMIGQMFTKQGEDYLPKQPLGESTAVSINNKNIMVGSDAALLADYKAGKSKAKLEDALLSKAKGNVLSAYLNVEKLVNNLPAEEMKLPDSVLNDIKGLLKDFNVISEPYSGKTQRSTIELNFKNENQNTLAQLITFSKKMFAYYEAQKKEDLGAAGATAVAIDSVAVATPTK